MLLRNLIHPEKRFLLGEEVKQEPKRIWPCVFIDSGSIENAYIGKYTTWLDTVAVVPHTFTWGQQHQARISEAFPGSCESSRPGNTRTTSLLPAVESLERHGGWRKQQREGFPGSISRADNIVILHRFVILLAKFLLRYMFFLTEDISSVENASTSQFLSFPVGDYRGCNYLVVKTWIGTLQNWSGICLFHQMVMIKKTNN